tara:strand:- start:1324 stop:1884 length:561 start_codon:yes stop_codon:yes gene_type:complete
MFDRGHMPTRKCKSSQQSYNQQAGKCLTPATVRRHVVNGTKPKSYKGPITETGGGLTKGDLTRKVVKGTKQVKYVSVEKQATATARYNAPDSGFRAWGDAVKLARKELKIKGFVPVGGETQEGKELVAKVRSLLPAKKAKTKKKKEGPFRIPYENESSTRTKAQQNRGKLVSKKVHEEWVKSMFTE